MTRDASLAFDVTSDGVATFWAGILSVKIKVTARETRRTTGEIKRTEKPVQREIENRRVKIDGSQARAWALIR
jgi:hypothetical protein